METSYELIKLTENDARNVYQMMQSFPATENGFNNPYHGMDFAEFQEELAKREAASRGEGLAEGYVPDTHYWFYVDGEPAGVLKIRHFLTPALRVEGGHIGYGITPEYRGKGHAKQMLLEGLRLARLEHKIDEVLLTVEEANTPSRKLIESAGGRLEKTTNLKDGKRVCYYWVTT